MAYYHRRQGYENESIVRNMYSLKKERKIEFRVHVLAKYGLYKEYKKRLSKNFTETKKTFTSLRQINLEAQLILSAKK